MIKHFILPKCVGYLHGLASMVYNFLDKNTFGSIIENENISNKELISRRIAQTNY